MVKLLEEPPEQYIFSVSNYTGAAAGDLVAAHDREAVDATGDRPIGFLIDELPTDNPPEMLSVYGEGSLIDLEGLTDENAGTEMFSDGDGTVSAVNPGDGGWSVGYMEGDEDGGASAHLRVEFDEVEA